VPLALIPLGLGLSYALGRGLFGEFRRAFGRTSWEALGVQGSPNRRIGVAAKAAGERARLLVELLLLAKDAGVSRREE
jgi:hypothetical protein